MELPATDDLQAQRVADPPEIPAVYLPLYTIAADAFNGNPWLLAALHLTESSFSKDRNCLQPNSAGAIGPMQFLPPTFLRYQDSYKQRERPATYPLRKEQHPHICDDFDSIMAAAAYMQALKSGPEIDHRTYEALTFYKGNPPYSFPYAQKAYEIAQWYEAHHGS